MTFALRTQVPYYQVDQQGVVFNMWYFAWFDEAMSAFLGAIGHPYRELIAEGVDVQLVHTEADWKHAVRYGDEPSVEVSATSVGAASFMLSFTVLRGAEVLATARTVYVVIATDGSGKLPIPDRLRAALESSP
jgi:acyl-CoA thioester hydrolase